MQPPSVVSSSHWLLTAKFNKLSSTQTCCSERKKYSMFSDTAKVSLPCPFVPKASQKRSLFVSSSIVPGMKGHAEKHHLLPSVNVILFAITLLVVNKANSSSYRCFTQKSGTSLQIRQYISTTGAMRGRLCSKSRLDLCVILWFSRDLVIL